MRRDSESLAREKKKIFYKQSYKFIVEVFRSWKMILFISPLRIPTNIKFPSLFAHFSARSISHSSVYVWWVPSIEKWDEQNGISFSLKWISSNEKAKWNREIETSWKQFKSTVPAFLSTLLPFAHRRRANLIIFQHERAAKWWRRERKIRKSEQECDNNFSLACPVRYRPHISCRSLLLPVLEEFRRRKNVFAQCRQEGSNLQKKLKSP